ncbi:helicase-related protein [Streptomyces sp. KL116D]|uniref:helicase-related protein n=1 Tax=Streptomyces sp. KL116D TaxID=3045152 RepID=UPI0035576D65
MSEQALERVVVDFWEKKFDVLVSTTIVESGIDISNANTLIVERGDNLGSLPAPPAARPCRPWAGNAATRTSSTRPRSP